MIKRPYPLAQSRRSLVSRRIAGGALLFLFGLAAQAQTITGFSPASGKPGNVITITGSGLTGATAVEFNTDSPTLGDFTNVSSSELLVVVPAGATSGQLGVMAGASLVSSAGSFLVAPAVTNFSPQSGTYPTVVSIFGANFISNGTTVIFSGATNQIRATYVASTEVAATVPAGAGNGPITVITSAGTNVSTNNFLASSLPSITSYMPTAAAYGAPVTIFGGNFVSPVTVKFGSVPAGSATIVSTTEITIKVPSGATNGEISVTTSSGSVTDTNDFLTSAGPIVTNFSPTVGSDNTVVTLEGIDLSSASSVTFNGSLEYISGYSETNLQVTLTNNPGSGPIKVKVGTASFTTPNSFTNRTTPMISDFYPVLGPPGTAVAIDGVNFTGVTAVKFGATSAFFSMTGAGTQLTANVPSGSTGNDAIEVVSPSGNYTATSNFTVTGAAPVITSFTPTNGVRGTVVTLNGANFTAVSSVKFNGVTASYQPPTTTTELIATVPATASSGVITVANSSGAGTSPSLFYMQPWITSLSATSGIVNSTFSITGRSLAGVSSLQVNGVNYNYTGNGPQIVATVPSNATTGQIEITTPGGVYISTNAFAILPEIYSFSPNIGPAGTVVTINGTSLFDVTNVLFNGASAPVSNPSASQLRVTVPADATSGPLTVVTPYGADASSNSFTATKSSLVLLTKTVSPVVASPGENVTYTLQLTNEGPSIVTSVMVTDYIPFGLGFLSATTGVGNWVYTNETVAWSMPFLTNGASVSLQIVGTSMGAYALTNIATVAFAEGNLVPAYGIATVMNYFVSDAQRTLSIAFQTHPPLVVVTWPLSPANLLLQENTNLTLSTNWHFPSSGTFVSNNLNSFTNSIASPHMYYRLAPP